MKTRFMTLLLMGSTGLAGPVFANTELTGCGRLMTEAECERHRQIVAELQAPEARRDYLDQHLAVLREREVMCACSGERDYLARARYR
ncbi:MAG: hypothetical protein ACOZB0_09045 [Pseudomonadota bacterium]